jgi:YjbE family integral membrane protein
MPGMQVWPQRADPWPRCHWAVSAAEPLRDGGNHCPASQKAAHAAADDETGGEMGLFAPDVKRDAACYCGLHGVTAVAKALRNTATDGTTMEIFTMAAWAEVFTRDGLTALAQVIGIDLVLAGDNAIVIGLAAAGLPKEQRAKAIVVGIIAATVLRIIFAGLTVQLLAITGLLLAGGILLLWVCWKMWRELREGGHAADDIAEEALTGMDLNADGTVAGGAPRKTFRQAALQILVADVSMSLDNVLAVAGAAKDHPIVLVIGLALSIALMGLAASFIARLLNKHRWIAYVGLAIILYVALSMMWEGWHEVQPLVTTQFG